MSRYAVHGEGDVRVANVPNKVSDIPQTPPARFLREPFSAFAEGAIPVPRIVAEAHPT